MSGSRYHRVFLLVGAVLLGTGVLLGAFGAHGLKHHLTPDLLNAYHTGVDYQMYHGLGLLIIGVLAGTPLSNRLLTLSGWLLVGGTVLFSGSLYALALTQLRGLGMITPFGGVLLVGGWALLTAALFQRSPSSNPGR